MASESPLKIGALATMEYVYLVVLWMLFVSNPKRGELYAALAAALIGTVADWVVKVQDFATFRPKLKQLALIFWEPWYALDGTHPEVQRHFETLFRTMRRGWGCTYFKLDANFWGAIQGGRFHDPRATRIEAYRRGMRAIARRIA